MPLCPVYILTGGQGDTECSPIHVGAGEPLRAGVLTAFTSFALSLCPWYRRQRVSKCGPITSLLTASRYRRAIQPVADSRSGAPLGPDCVLLRWANETRFSRGAADQSGLLSELNSAREHSIERRRNEADCVPD